MGREIETKRDRDEDRERQERQGHTEIKRATERGTERWREVEKEQRGGKRYREVARKG